MASIKKRPDGKWRARYRDDAGKEHSRHFTRKVDAARWLAENEQARADGGTAYDKERYDSDAAFTRFLRSSGRSPRASKDGRTALYRHYDAIGRLLYVGVSNRLANRTRSHVETAPWFTSVVRTVAEYYESRADALAAERAAVVGERPLHNVLLQRTEEEADGGRSTAR